jgi:hypothetical protein
MTLLPKNRAARDCESRILTAIVFVKARVSLKRPAFFDARLFDEP